VETPKRSKRIWALRGVALGVLCLSVLGLGCIPRATPKQYYAAKRSTSWFPTETTSGSWMILEHSSPLEERKKIATRRSALKRYAAEHQEEVKAADDYVKGMSDGYGIGRKGNQIDLKSKPNASQAWREGASTGGKLGLMTWALEHSDEELMEKTLRELLREFMSRYKKRLTDDLVRKMLERRPSD
jgi:hypothetical protein